MEDNESREEDDAPLCCGRPMVVRRRRHDGHEFWGCYRFPRCKKTYSMEEWIGVPPDGWSEEDCFDFFDAFHHDIGDK